MSPVTDSTLRAVLNYRGDRHQKIQNSFYLISDVQVKCFIRVSERFDKTIASAWKIAVSIILCNGRPAFEYILSVLSVENLALKGDMGAGCWLSVRSSALPSSGR